MLFVIPSIAVVFACALLFFAKRAKNPKKAKKLVLMNAGVFLTAVVVLTSMAVIVSAAAPESEKVSSSQVEITQQDTTQGAQPDSSQSPAQGSIDKGLGYLAAALVTGLSCIGAGIAIASTAPAAIGAFSEDPKAFGKALIFVVLGEGVALYGLLISILLINKL